MPIVLFSEEQRERTMGTNSCQCHMICCASALLIHPRWFMLIAVSLSLSVIRVSKMINSKNLKLLPRRLQINAKQCAIQVDQERPDHWNIQIAQKLNHWCQTAEQLKKHFKLFHPAFAFLHICGRMIMFVLIMTFCGHIYR